MLSLSSRRNGTTGCRQQRQPFVADELQGISEEIRRLTLRVRPDASFQIADGSDADASTLREFLLSQIALPAMLPQEIPKGW